MSIGLLVLNLGPIQGPHNLIHNISQSLVGPFSRFKSHMKVIWQFGTIDFQGDSWSVSRVINLPIKFQPLSLWFYQYLLNQFPYHLLNTEIHSVCDLSRCLFSVYNCINRFLLHSNIYICHCLQIYSAMYVYLAIWCLFIIAYTWIWF